MKIFNLPRQKGKTMRMLYASEFNNAPILCATEASKRYIEEKANNLEIDIPKPITVYELLKKGSTPPSFVLIDEMDMVLSTLMQQAFNVKVEAVTITTDKQMR